MKKRKKLNPFVRTLMFQPQNCSNLRRAPSCLFVARRQKPACPLTLVHAWSTLARDRSSWQASPSALNRLTSGVSGVWISFFRFVSHHIVYIAQKEKKKWPERRLCCLSASATKIKQPDIQGGFFFKAYQEKLLLNRPRRVFLNGWIGLGEGDRVGCCEVAV